MPPIYDDCNDEYDIFGTPTIEEEINYDFNMPPIFDDYGDENNNDNYFTICLLYLKLSCYLRQSLNKHYNYIAFINKIVTK
jgi:hypothetical protein